MRGMKSGTVSTMCMRGVTRGTRVTKDMMGTRCGSL